MSVHEVEVDTIASMFHVSTTGPIVDSFSKCYKAVIGNYEDESPPLEVLVSVGLWSRVKGSIFLPCIP